MKYYNFSQRHDDEMALFNNLPVYEEISVGHQNTRLIDNLNESNLNFVDRPSNRLIKTQNKEIKKNISRCFKAASTWRKNRIKRIKKLRALNRLL